MDKSHRCGIACFWMGLALLLINSAVFQAMAQIEEDNWLPPVNISQSGSAVRPVLAVDAAGMFHVFWQEPSAGFVYSSGDGRDWNAPAPLRLPFSEPFFFQPGDEGFESLYMPRIVIDADGLAHGFWINEAGNLLYSRAPLPAVTDQTSWTFPVTLAESAAALDVTLDENGRFHLGYIRPRHTAQFPAGVYYNSSASGGAEWADATMAYQSQYLSAPVESANIKISASDDTVLLAWDNRLLDSVYVAQSGDGGASWGPPALIDNRTPEDDLDTAGPADIDVAIVGEVAHLTWHAERTIGSCVQYHQWSRNRGATWQPAPSATGDSFLDCPTEGRLVTAQDGLLFLMTRLGNDGFLQVWDGEQWSEPELQEPLAGFTHPLTFRPVDFSCYQTAVTPENRLFVFGCGQGTDTDIWVIERPLGVLNDWIDQFAPTPVWATPATMASGPFAFAFPELVVAEDGRLHAFWSQPADNSEPGLADQSGSAIYYTRLNAGQWAPPRPVITSPAGKTDQPSAGADSEGNLFIVWSGGESGQLFFSRAVADRASSVTEWIAPLPLPTPGGIGSWPDIALDDDGALFVAYSVPLNENRGIYLTQSNDGGNSWTNPTLVFDGVAADWDMVGQPRLALTGSGILHLIWTRRTLPSGIGPMALVYARSEDGGQTWSEPEEATQQPAVWSELVTIGERGLHRAWLAVDGGRLALFHQYSIDRGLTWSLPGNVFTPEVSDGPAALVEAADGPHLLQLVRNRVDETPLVQEWLWDGARWRPGDALSLEQAALEMNAITAVAAPDGRFGVIFTILNAADNQLQHDLFYTERLWVRPAAAATPLPTLTATPPPLPTNTPAPQPSPTPTLSFSTSTDSDGGFQIGPFSVNDEAGNVVISLIPVIVLIVIALIVSARMMRTK